MATLTDSTNLTGTITLSKATGTKVTLDTDKKYLTKDIELTINAPSSTITTSGATVSYTNGWVNAGSTTVTDSNLIPANIVSGVSIFGVTGTYTGVVIDETPDTNGGTITTITTGVNTLKTQGKVGITPMTTSQTIIPDSGYDALSSVQIDAMPSGFVGSPVIIKGEVTSTHKITIASAVACNAGYIEEGTKVASTTVDVTELESGTKTITQNGTGISVSGYSTVDVNVPTGSGSGTYQAKTDITPTESSQTITPDSGYDALSSVQINAISSTYVGSGITQRSSTDLTASGATVTVPAGYYSEQASTSVTTMTLPTSAASSATSGYTSKATISRSTSAQYINIPPGYNSAGGYYTISATPNGTVTAPSSISGTSASITTGTNTITLTKTVSVTPNVSTAGYISSGTAGNSSVSLTASVATKAAATITPSTSDQTIASGTYLTGTQTIAGDADLVASNIISTANIFGVQGSVVINKYYTGSAAPSSSLGNNGDIYFQE